MDQDGCCVCNVCAKIEGNTESVLCELQVTNYTSFLF